MKFKEAFDKVFDDSQKRQPEGVEFKVTRGTVQILAFLWSMLAVAKNVLDDKAYIDDNNNIVSVPLKESKEKDQSGKPEQETGEQKKQKEDKKQNGQKSKSTDNKTVQKKEAEGSVDTDNEQEKQKE